MRTSVIGPRLKSIVAMMISTIVLLSGIASAQNNDSPKGTVMLKDPTPRPPDLEQQYDVDGGSLGVHEHATFVLNTQRQQLIAHASKDLTSLATSLEYGLDTHKPGTPLDDEQTIASLIQTLAKNINTALQVGAPSKQSTLPPASKARLGPSPSPALTPEENSKLLLQSDSARIVELSRQLEQDVALSARDTLSVSALTRSAEIESLAKDLRQRLKKYPRT